MIYKSTVKLVVYAGKCKNENSMNKAPKHKVTLALGVLLFVASPLLFFLTPNWLFQPLLCNQNDIGIWFACTAKIYTASLYLSIVTLTVGTVLMFWALQVKSRILEKLFHGRYRGITVTITAVAAALTIYLVLLSSPFTSSWFQYPYYRAFCGKEPVVVISGRGFEGSKIITPDSNEYQIGGFNQRLFCNEASARAHKYEYLRRLNE